MTSPPSHHQPTLNIRRSLSRRSGENLSYNLLGISLEQHQKQLQQLFTNRFVKIINEALPQTLTEQKFIKKKEEFKAEEYAKDVQRVLEKQMDKLGVYLGDNIFGRTEVINGEKMIERKKRKLEDQAKRIMSKVETLSREYSQLAVERAARQYRAELAAINVEVKRIQRKEEQNQARRELEARTRNALHQLRQLNQQEENQYGNFLKKGR